MKMLTKNPYVCLFEYLIIALRGAVHRCRPIKVIVH